MKKVITVLIVIGLVIGVCGCMENNGRKKALVIEHLENKYNEHFEIISFQPRNIDSPYDEIVCKNEVGDKISVYFGNEIDGNAMIVDNYYGIINKSEYKKILNEIISEYISGYKLFSNFTASYFDNMFTKDTEIESIIIDNKEQFFSRNYLFISETTAKMIDQREFFNMCENIEKYGLSLLITIYSVPDDEYAMINEYNDVNIYLPDDFDEMPLYKKMIK